MEGRRAGRPWCFGGQRLVRLTICPSASPPLPIPGRSAITGREGEGHGGIPGGNLENSNSSFGFRPLPSTPSTPRSPFLRVIATLRLATLFRLVERASARESQTEIERGNVRFVLTSGRVLFAFSDAGNQLPEKAAGGLFWWRSGVVQLLIFQPSLPPSPSSFPVSRTLPRSAGHGCPLTDMPPPKQLQR